MKRQWTQEQVENYLRMPLKDAIDKMILDLNEASDWLLTGDRDTAFRLASGVVEMLWEIGGEL